MEPESTLLSVADAATRLNRSTEQVRRYLREGRLKGQRLGGQWFIDRSVLDTFADAVTTPKSFVDRLPPAADLAPFDDIIAIGTGPGANIGQGKAAYRAASLGVRS
jgi:excisionase family DNA binding protein